MTGFISSVGVQLCVASIKLEKLADMIDDCETAVQQKMNFGRLFEITSKDGVRVMAIENGVHDPIIFGLANDVIKITEAV